MSTTARWRDFGSSSSTPPGSACSISIGQGLTEAVPGTLQGMQICVGDIDAAHAQLVERGVDVSPIRHVDQAQGGWADGKGGVYNSFILFKDPDGNGWAIQESPLLGGAGSGERMTDTARIDAILGGLPVDQRVALQHLRETIAQTAPDAVEAMSYGAPAFRYLDHPLVSYAAAKAHCAFYVMSPDVIVNHEADLAWVRHLKGHDPVHPGHAPSDGAR